MNPRIAPIKKNYSQALFDLFKESNDLQALVQQMDALSAVLKEDAFEFFLSPAVTRAEKEEVLGFVSEKLQVQDVVINFIKTLIYYDRFHLFQDIMSDLKKLTDEELKIARIEVISATSMEESESLELSRSLEGVLHKKIVLSHSIRDDLLFGYILRTDDKTIDASLKMKLESLKHDLLSI